MKAVGIAGTGTMGGGIAMTFARSGWEVLLYDISKEIVVHALEVIGNQFQREVVKGRIQPEDAQAALARIHPRTDLADFAEAHLVIETVPEILSLKKELFHKLDEICNESVPITSNTSSLSIGAIASVCNHKERIAGFHFFNPAYKMKLVEVIKTDFLSKEILNELLVTVRQIGKTPVVARDTPGFIVNRCSRHFYLEPLRVLSERVAGVEEIDYAFLQAGFGIGPFAMLDLIGLDVNFAVSQSIYEQYFFEPRFRPVLIQSKMVELNRLGRKTGSGFYNYANEKPKACFKLERRAASISEALRELSMKIINPLGVKAPLNDQQVFTLARTISMIVNEAHFMIEEGVASQADIDLAIKLGTSFPGGPFEFTESIGRYLIGEFLQSMRKVYGDIYRPSPLLTQ
jgi:3-hydroxybutyryl-CoA dehydrogenase